MNNNLLVLSVYSRGYKAANDDGSSVAERRSARQRRDRVDEGQADSATGWDPYEVWRTRIRGDSDRDSRKR